MTQPLPTDPVPPGIPELSEDELDSVVGSYDTPASSTDR